MMRFSLPFFRRSKPAVIVQTYTRKQMPRPNINDALHMKLKAEIEHRSHEQFADAFDHARRAR